MEMATSKILKAPTMLTTKKKSKTPLGIGNIIMATTETRTTMRRN
jgi:hypothetical protein